MGIIKNTIRKCINSIDIAIFNMITASLVLYKTKEEDVHKVINCVNRSIIDYLYVIDNSPSDSLRAVVNSLIVKGEYLYGHGNIGYGKAHNFGIGYAINNKVDYHIVLNPDIYFEPSVIERLKDFADKKRDVGLILPKVIYPNGDLQYLCKLLPSPIDIFGRRFFPAKLKQRRNARFEMHKMGYDKIWNCPILSGCFMFMRVSDLKRAGGFDEQFFMYFEDFDLMRRLHRVCKTVFFPYETIIHDHAAAHHTDKALLKASMKSAILYFNKWGWFIDKDREIVNKHAFDDDNRIYAED